MISLFRVATFFTVIISTVLAIYVYNNRKKSPSLRYLSRLMIANMVYATSYLFEISAPLRAEVVLFLYLEYLGITFIPVFWILIAWSYHPGRTKSNPAFERRLRLLYVIPITMIVFIWTNSWHHLMYRSIDMELALPITLLKVDRAPGFWVVNGILILQFFFGTIRMVYNLGCAKDKHRRQYLLLTLAAIPPFASYMLVLGQRVPYNLDLSPIAFAISGLLVFWGIMNMQLFNLVPIAEHMVVNAMHDAMIVLDTKGNLIESNSQAQLLLGESDATSGGIPIRELNPEVSEIVTSMQESAEAEITVPSTGERRIYTFSRSPILDARNRLRGYLFLLHDITEIRSYVRELEHTASSDGLTGLLNHRHFMNLAQQEADRLHEQGRGHFSLIMFDLDHFKAINDTYGHSAGDMVLQRIGQIVRSHARPQDICARYGGEEFVMLLVDTPLETASVIADRLCRDIRDTQFISGLQRLTVTASFGVSSFMVERKDPWELALNRADSALYEAKAAGRNQVFTATAQ